MNLVCRLLLEKKMLDLLVVGPKNLTALARQLGKYMAEFKRASYEFKSQLETEMMNIELEERAKKQEDAPKILPPEKLWEPSILPATGIVSRGNSEDISEAVTGSEPNEIAQAKPLPSTIPASTE